MGPYPVELASSIAEDLPLKRRVSLSLPIIATTTLKKKKNPLNFAVCTEVSSSGSSSKRLNRRHRRIQNPLTKCRGRQKVEEKRRENSVLRRDSRRKKKAQQLRVGIGVGEGAILRGANNTVQIECLFTPAYLKVFKCSSMPPEQPPEKGLPPPLAVAHKSAPRPSTSASSQNFASSHPNLLQRLSSPPLNATTTTFSSEHSTANSNSAEPPEKEFSTENSSFTPVCPPPPPPQPSQPLIPKAVIALVEVSEHTSPEALIGHFAATSFQGALSTVSAAPLNLPPGSRAELEGSIAELTLQGGESSLLSILPSAEDPAWSYYIALSKASASSSSQSNS